MLQAHVFITDEQCNADVVINIRSFNNGLYFAELRGKQEVYRVKFTKAD
jgi:hypothetical protein